MDRRDFNRALWTGWIGVAISSQALGRSTLAAMDDRFFQILNGGQLRDLAPLFHYPEQYTERQHEEDAQCIVRFFAGLAEAVGKPRARKVGALESTVCTVSVGAGDIAYWTTHTELAHSFQTNYVVAVAGGDLGVSLNWLPHDRDSFDLRNVACNIPLTRPGGQELAVQLLKTALPAP